MNAVSHWGWELSPSHIQTLFHLPAGHLYALSQYCRTCVHEPFVLFSNNIRAHQLQQHDHRSERSCRCFPWSKKVEVSHLLWKEKICCMQNLLRSIIRTPQAVWCAKAAPRVCAVLSHSPGFIPSLRHHVISQPSQPHENSEHNAVGCVPKEAAFRARLCQQYVWQLQYAVKIILFCY